MLRGVRGATSVNNDSQEEIFLETEKLLLALFKENNILSEDIASILFSSTDDLKSAFPAEVARKKMALTHVPLMCCKELDIHGSLKKCIRVLIHWNTSKPQSDIQHIYLNEASKLRPDR